ncbi:hypothetical protein NPIL_161431 [Nephila pilipes]|uniref:Transposase n=1 Tax=Nephila pilipes TaxID=299642 RepID=A0A8X6QQK9_NEPPI|nr:hypothetical protein NPIL_161431 [Nephila pilipes]
MIFTSPRRLVDWCQFFHEQVLNHVELMQNKICWIGKVEVDESTFCKKKYNIGENVEVWRIFEGVEHDSENVFLVAIHDHTPRHINWVDQKLDKTPDYYNF